MLDIAIQIVGLILCASLILTLYRLLVGPKLPDRILALDTMFIHGIALILLYGIAIENAIYFEAALLIAMLGFVSTSALCKYLLRGDIIE
ncbi:MAG: K+/H+ antiporter subunit F [Marinomonas sp.]|jgi:multicomponent K+:H+ antiporter subunit F|uniref:K+/H+ antiporter subunit F n=1 Tax=unclassified Marinomonas TaxID=196814 RepID=UPI0005FA29E6|nr:MULTISPECIES: K+/H+ antiporter subunit F [unclassified Marinomonas]KJZ12293.1 cation:proton antiporter [Marinomonas sp. S3726]KZM39323.1 cation:proton antiporter [Marinomonas sp. SBI22]KZM40130.1 cation:proton antiporter [Marinomonas sp. SBI8L]